MTDGIPLTGLADAEAIFAQLEHISADLHDLSRRFAAVEEKISSWETRAEPLLKLRETAKRMSSLGRGRD